MEVFVWMPDFID